MKPERKGKKLAIGWLLAAFVCFTLAVMIMVVLEWYMKAFDTSLAGLLFTVTIPQKGTGASAVMEPLKILLPRMLMWIGGFLLLLILLRVEFLWRGKAAAFRRGAEKVLVTFGILSFIAAPVYGFFRLDGPDYLRRVRAQTRIYEEEYVSPNEIALKAPEERPNLISLYLESMETTYASVSDGGRQTVNYMPELTRLSRENISFSNTDRLGGIHSTDNTNWTMAALFAGTSGLPFAFPVQQNSMNKYTSFAAEAVTLGDILAREGYTQEFLCGSDGEYGGRALYFREHGGYEIYDLWKARENGDIPSDYYVWWGFEDLKLFEIAKKELTRLYEAGQPFNLTILTVDAHHLGGYVCEACGTEYADKTANVIACTDRQVAAFVDWCRQQPFWDQTVMVINGDHPRMDTCLTEGVPFKERTIYNCFLNARKQPLGEVNFRSSTMMDLYPTTLSAMGFEIAGNRLGLGTDLFSGEKTLAERMGYEALNDEVQKYSQFFLDHFTR